SKALLGRIVVVRSAPNRILLLSPNRLEMAVTDQLALLLVPEPVGEGFETGEERDGFHGLEKGLGLMTFFEVVIRNPRTEMVDVVVSDVAGEPLQRPGQFVERTAFQRRRSIIPLRPAFPINVLELM